MSTVICKVQRSVNGSRDRVLVYSRDRRTVFYEGSMVPDMSRLLGQSDKVFVEGIVDSDGSFIVQRRLAVDPGW